MGLVFLLHFIVYVASILLQANAFSMKMIPIHSPHLNIIPQNFEIQDRLRFLANISSARAIYARNRGNNFTSDSIRTRVYQQLTNYYVTAVHWGDPSAYFSAYLVIDTFSDQTWLQCSGCDPCFDLIKGGNIRVEDSPTYVRMRPDDSRCASSAKVIGGACGYDAYYGKGHSEGYFGTDTFIFANAENQSQSILNVAFGCGIHNFDFYFGSNTGENNTIAGVFGLTPGPRSFLTQLSKHTQGKFSYCLTQFSAANPGVSTLYFGEDAIIKGDPQRTVQQIAMKAESRYHLYFAGITVDGKTLQIDPSLFVLDDKGYTRGFFIDSGTPFTVLPNSAYQVFKSALVAYFATYQIEPTKPIGDVDLCFNRLPDSSKRETYPRVTFTFVQSIEGGESDLNFQDENMFTPTDPSGFCVLVIPTDDPGPSLLGSYQQVNFGFRFDVNNEVLFFVPERCEEKL